MSSFYEKFVNEEIGTRQEIIKHRKVIMSWGIDSQLPPFFIEKTNELKLMVILAMDNFAYKALSIYIEEVLMHMLIADEISPSQDYTASFNKLEKQFKYGHSILTELEKRGLIHEDDLRYCKRFLNDHKNGGERIRNIEVHNLLTEKIANFELRPELEANLNEFGKEFLLNEVKTKPAFIQIGARDMVARTIVNDLAGLHDLLNRNVGLLRKLA